MDRAQVQEIFITRSIKTGLTRTDFGTGFKYSGLFSMTRPARQLTDSLPPSSPNYLPQQFPIAVDRTRWPMPCGEKTHWVCRPNSLASTSTLLLHLSSAAPLNFTAMGPWLDPISPARSPRQRRIPWFGLIPAPMFGISARLQQPVALLTCRRRRRRLRRWSRLRKLGNWLGTTADAIGSFPKLN